MFASLLAAILPAAAQILPIVVPLGKPPLHVEQAVAPIETAGPAFAAACKDWDEWDKPAPPVRIHANTYLVGTCGISAILITGSAGDILIDGGPEAAADLIARNIRLLGFRLRDVKILLHSHEHGDHVGGIARLQQLTGARLFASPAAAKVLRTGTAGAGDPQAGINRPFPPARVDRIIEDGEAVRLGDLTADGGRDARPHAGCAELALGRLRRRSLPPDRLCRQPDRGQPRRLSILRSSRISRRLPREPRRKSPRSTATYC